MEMSNRSSLLSSRHDCLIEAFVAAKLEVFAPLPSFSYCLDLL